MLKKITLMVLVSLVLVSSVALCADNELRIMVWRGYFSQDVMDSFEKEFNAKVSITPVDTYEEVFNALRNESDNYDLIITGELAFPVLIEENLLEPLDKSLIPNFSNLDPLFKGLSFDPENSYTLPYHYIYIGLIYHKDRVNPSEATLQNYFETPEKFKGRIATFPNKRIMIGMAMKYIGSSFNSLDEGDLELAKMLLENLKENVNEESKNMSRGILDGYFDLLNDKADIGISFAAESTRRVLKADQVGIILPVEGANVGTDDMAIVRDAKNIELAHKFINYYYDPQVAAMSVNQLGNPFPVKGVKDLLKPELANNPAVYPPTEIAKKLEFPTPMSNEELAIYEQLWNEVFGE